VLDIEHEAEHGGGGESEASDGCLNIGSLRGEQQNPDHGAAQLAKAGIKP
jgi:hypothetical protein